MDPQPKPHPSSFRDPSGFIFEKDGVLYRQVHQSYREHYDLLLASGAYEKFTGKGYLIPHKEIDTNFTGSNLWFKTLQPEIIPFISYPWEWSYDMLRNAALLTLKLARDSMGFGMMLKDASVFKIQCRNAHPVLIDTLSFEKYEPSKPWIAYRQFCEHFLGPLLLMYYSRQDLRNLLLSWPDGVPLSVTQSLLPWRSRLSFYSYLHIHLHASMARKSVPQTSGAVRNFSAKKMEQLLDSLSSLVKSLEWKGISTTWKDYYKEANQREGYVPAKEKIIEQWLKELPQLRTAADLGANEGNFSFLLARQNIHTVSTDFDHEAINTLYKKLGMEKIGNIQPLVIDLSQPSPAVGLNNRERASFLARVAVDLVLSLALIHHLCIGKNSPFRSVASMFSKMGRFLIVEFVPKEDEKVQFMLQQKEDIYPDYTESNFIRTFETCFTIIKKEIIAGSGRTLYLMRRYE